MFFSRNSASGFFSIFSPVNSEFSEFSSENSEFCPLLEDVATEAEIWDPFSVLAPTFPPLARVSRSRSAIGPRIAPGVRVGHNVGSCKTCANQVLRAARVSTCNSYIQAGVLCEVCVPERAFRLVNGRSGGT